MDIDLSRASTAGRRAAELVQELLDTWQPTRVDPSRSRIWVDQNHTFIAVAHGHLRRADLHLVVHDSGWAQLYGPHGYTEVRGSGRGQAEWVDELTKSVTALLTGHHTTLSHGASDRHASVDYGCRLSRP